MLTERVDSRARNKWLVAVATLAVAVLMLSNLAAPVQAAPQNVEDGELVWGVRQSFRNYITGPIAHGTITTSGGASQASGNGVFTFPNATGVYDADAGTLSAAFAGGVHFEGHSGILDVQVSNLRVEVSGTSGAIVADVVSREFIGITDAGPPITYTDVELVSLNLTGITPVVNGNSVTFSNIPSTLTAEGEPAFGGFYPAGDAFDPVSFTVVLGEGGGGEPGADSATQTITTEVVATGGLSISVAGDEVILPSPVLNGAGTALVSTGAIHEVTVTDLRSGNPGWNASGQVSDFTSATSSFSGNNLGWTPEVISTSTEQTVTPGASVPGLASPAQLGSADAGEGYGSAVLGADLELSLPTDTEPGEYSGTLTLTVI